MAIYRQLPSVAQSGHGLCNTPATLFDEFHAGGDGDAEVRRQPERRARHHGHAGAHTDGGGETHFNVAVESAAFTGKSRVDRQRLVYGILADELKERVHALALKLTAPGE